MEKRLLLALALSVLVMIAWQYLFMPQPPTGNNQASQEQTSESTPKGKVEAAADSNKKIPEESNADGAKVDTNKVGTNAEVKSDESAKQVAPNADVANEEVPQKVEEEIEVWDEKLFKAELTNLSAAFKSFVLKPKKYRLHIETDSGKEEIPIDLVSSKVVHNPAVLPFALEFPVQQGFKFSPKMYGWSAEKTDKGFKFYKDTTSGVRIVKEYEFISDYQFRFRIIIENRSGKPVVVAPSVVLSSWRSPDEKEQSSFMASSAGSQRFVKALFDGESLEKEDDREELQAGWKKSGRLYWAGIDEHYFLQAIIPEKLEQISVFAKEDKEGLLKVNVTLPQYKIDSANKTSFEFRVFMGPKEYNLLKSAGRKLDESIDFWVLGFLARPMLWVLQKSYDLLGNWGLAILVLTILVRLLMLPLTHKSQVSMQRMKDLKPKIDALKEKYKDDRDEFNKRVMDLYRREKVNPLGGCFPILLQMPVYIALYRTLWGAVELYNAPFIPGWIDDLSKPEPFTIKILPLLLGVFMFVQQKLTPQTMENEQQKMLMYIMPVMMVFFLWFLPSGLNLYILMSTVLGLLQQLVYNKLKIGGGVGMAKGKA